jgi:putative protease
MQKVPELLLPAGNIESFFAALKGGADAVYLGLKQFNARGRAKNFTREQLPSLVDEARKQQAKIYITLNTVIKNNEISELLDYLYFLSHSGVNGIIIQDWGVFYIAKKYFPKLSIHASTQLGIHNSTGTVFAEKSGFGRIVLARELTLGELQAICSKSRVETEVFIHGALCYSFSGMCLYSSYAGGRGANRGLCTQPCRRVYTNGNKNNYIFNLKDNQLIDYLDSFAEMGVTSLKVEGRMKSGEYTYRVAKAYRTALDGKNKQEAKNILALDFGRLKTAYFMGKDVKEAISDKTVAGLYLGKVHEKRDSRVLISSKMKIEPGFRLRFHIPESEKQESVKVRNVENKNGLYEIDAGDKRVKINSEVYLSGLSAIKFPTKINEVRIQNKQLKYTIKKNILQDIKGSAKGRKEELYFRINSMEWLHKMNLNEMDSLFLNFTRFTWNKFDPHVPFIQKFRDKIYVELPRFIQEDALVFYAGLVDKMVKAGIRNFVISHLSQKLLIPNHCRVISNENVYVFNDAAAKNLGKEGVHSFCFPQEIDFETLFSITHKNGIVPVYFHPELFYSRMPVDVESNSMKDDNNIQLRRFRRNGITSIVPEVPVSIFQSRNKLKNHGFSRYLIDLSFESPSKNRIKTLKSRLFRSEQIKPSTTFNFVKGLK